MTDSMIENKKKNYPRGCSSCAHLITGLSFLPAKCDVLRGFSEAEYRRICRDADYRAFDCPFSVENAEESSASKPIKKKENPSKFEELNKNVVELNKNLDALITIIDDLALAIKQRF